MTKILIESTNAIFQQDELKQDTSIYIHLLNANFIGKVDTFELEIDSIKATWIDDTTMFFNKINIVNDSLKFDKVSIPYYNLSVSQRTSNTDVGFCYRRKRPVRLHHE